MNILHIILVATLAILFVFALRATLHSASQRSRFERHGRIRFRRLSRLERLAVPFVLALRELDSWFHRPPSEDRLALANIVALVPNTYLTDAAIGRFKVLKKGTDEYHVDVCGTGDVPYAMNQEDSAAAAEANLAVKHFGELCHTRGTASGAITNGDLLVPGANGSVRTLPAGAGTYYIIGQAKATVADGAEVPFVASGICRTVVS